jgi:uncharacterized protein YrrD
MTTVKFTIGARVHCQDGRCGVLHKVVLDPHTHRLTDLVVEKGFLQRQDRVLPVSLVKTATAEDIYLTLGSAELVNYPEYREVEFEQPAPGWEPGSRYRREDSLHWSTYYGLPDYADPLIPMIRKRVKQGIKSDLAVIGRDTPVRTIGGVIGKVDHLLVDQQTQAITHLVVQKGLFPYQLIIPISWVEQVEGEEIFIKGEHEELKTLPRYTARPAEDILTEVRSRLNAAPLDFS